MENQNKSISEFERNNRVAMICHLIDVSLMEILALLQWLSGSGSALMFLAYFVVGMFSPIAEFVCWRKDHETKMIKHFVGYGYAVYFTLVIFTATDAIFFFVIPLLLVITIFNDVPYTLKINLGVVIESFIVTIAGGITGKFGYTTMNNAIIQDLVVLLVAIFSIVVAKTTHRNFQDKVDKIQNIMATTDSGIAAIHEDLVQLLEATNNTRIAMEQVSEGTNNTAEAVQSQMLQTSEIGEKTSSVETVANEIQVSMQATIECVDQGKQDLQKLIDEVDETVESGENIATLLSTLQDNMGEMDKISKMIDSIAFQTNILALNANVEAARAGDAGRGFAVVADEVSAMSIKTKESTEVISQMISNISESLDNVIDGIKKITEEINSEKEAVSNSQASFASIEENARTVNDRVATLVGTLNELTNANHGIMDSIQTISSVSEEVSALAAEAQTQEFKNADVLNHISEAAEKLVISQQ